MPARSLLAVPLLGLVLACAGGATEDDPVEPGLDAKPLDEDVVAAVSPCSLLTRQDVAAIVGADVGEPVEETLRPRVDLCTWSPADPQRPALHVAVRYATPMPTHREIVEELGAEGEAEVIDGLGDFALYVSGSLHVWSSDVKLQLSLVPPGALADLRALAETAIERLQP